MPAYNDFTLDLNNKKAAGNYFRKSLELTTIKSEQIFISKKLKQLEAAGVTQFNIYLMCGEEERQIAEYAEHVLPHFR